MCNSNYNLGRLVLFLIFALSSGLADSTPPPPPPPEPPSQNPNQDVIILSPAEFFVGQANLISVKSRVLIRKLTIVTKHEGIRDFSFTLDPEPINPSSPGWYQYDVNYPIPYQSDEDSTLSVRIHFLINLCEDQVDCNSVKVVNITQIKTIVSSTLLILGETDKPIYRPGELVRIRFLAVDPNANRKPEVNQSSKPEYLVYRNDEGNLMLKPYQQSKQDKSSIWGPKFEQILITNPNGDRVKQWLNPTAFEAANLSFRLLPDAEQGSWHIQAKLGHQTENLKISVKKYVLPRFLISIEPPKQLFQDSKVATFPVCAKYTNGQPMKGTAHVSFCICDTYDLSREYNVDDDNEQYRGRLWRRDRTDTNSQSKKSLEDLLENPTCPKNRYAPIVQPCLTKSQPLLSNGCTTFNLIIENYSKRGDKFVSYSEKPIICVRVEEDGTGSSVAKCDIGSQISVRQRNLKLEFPASYRPGLPILGRIRFESDQLQNDKMVRKVKIVVEEFNMRCGWFHEPSKIKQHLYANILELDSRGVASVLIPPIHKSLRLRIQAQLVDQEPTEQKSDSKANDIPDVDTRLPSPPTITISDHIMDPWLTFDDGAMQIWSEETILKPKCPGELRLKLIANQPLANRYLFMESVVRRKHLALTFAPDLTTTSDECKNRNDHLGHYTCQNPNSNEITCLTGWQGKDCLEPICAPNCHKLGGTCARPGECLCRPGWNGTNCDQCIVRLGCKHGKCELGDDCVCEPGWRGYYCSQKVVKYGRVDYSGDENMTTEIEESVPTEQENKSFDKANISKPIRTLYEREISFHLDSNWGPEANVVLYFIVMTDNETSLIATSFRLEGLTECTSSAIATQKASHSNGLAIDPKTVDPGARVQLKIIPHVLNKNNGIQSEKSESNVSDSSELCFVRISDTALDNYDGGSKNLVDFDYYANKLKQYGSADKDFYKLPESNQEAFHLAGLQLSTSFPYMVVRPTFGPCMVASMVRSGLPAPLGMMREHEPVMDSGFVLMKKPRLRDFFPEVWLFDVYQIRELPSTSNAQGGSPIRQRGVQLDLTVPDTITTWRASSFCTTQNDGMFITNPQTLLVSMPFFIDLTIPKEVKRGEILHLPLSVFVYDRSNNDQPNYTSCYEVSVITELDQNDWLLIGADKYMGCVCTGEKQTFIMSLMPKRLGHLNVTAEAFALPNSQICSSENLTGQNKAKPLADKVRRSIEVVPEGIATETSVGDIICLNGSQTSTEHKFPLNLPSNIVPGSLRTYVSYSDEVLGPALVNLDNLVKLPVGCGEQNMVLVAPNVFVLDYLLSTTESNTTKYKSLIQKARGHIQKGYQQQLKYRRTDGSFSAWGQSDPSGSTWLTAFVLRVFHKATELGLKFDFDKKMIFDDTIQYLLSQQDPLTGCFLEKGRVLHQGMQGSVGDKGTHILLTTYVSSVLWSIIPKDENLAKLRNETLERVRTMCLKSTESVNWTNVSTPVLVQYAHNMMLMDLDSKLYSELVELVRGRSRTIVSGSMSKMYWPRDVDSNDQDSNEARDIETTAYAYLTLAKADIPSSELLPIVRWLSSQQKAQGGFHSTQDTVMGLEVISDFAKRLGLSSKLKKQSNIHISFAIEPFGFSKTDLFTVEQRGYLNRQQILVKDPEQIALSLWNLTTDDPSDQQCLTVHIALLYNLPDPAINDQSHFHVTSKVTQSMTQLDKSCTKADLFICVRPNLYQNKPNLNMESGMILISVTMVTGWTPSEDLISSHMNSSSVDAVKRIEIGDKGQVSIYFDGFSQTEADQIQGWSNVKRCVTVSMHQTVYIENAKPAVVTVRDYYMSERMVETSYKLNDCREAWQINARPVNPSDNEATLASTTVTPNTTPSPIVQCPKCGLDEQTKSQLVDALYRIRCQTSNNLIFVQPLSNDADQINITVSILYWGNTMATWNASMNRTSFSNCKCDPIDNLEPLIVYSPSGLNFYAGDSQLTLIRFANRQDVEPFSLEDNSVFVLSVSKIMKFVDPLINQWNQKTNDTQCKHFETLIKYIKRKIAE